MADNYGAKPYDYADYYKPIRGSQLEDTTPFMDKLRAMFSAFGVDQTPVDLNDPNASIGAKLRGGLGLAPALQPRAVQADVRKSDNAMAVPAVPNFGAVAPAPSAPAGASGAGASAPIGALGASNDNARDQPTNITISLGGGVVMGTGASKVISAADVMTQPVPASASKAPNCTMHQ